MNAADMMLEALDGGRNWSADGPVKYYLRPWRKPSHCLVLTVGNLNLSQDQRSQLWRTLEQIIEEQYGGFWLLSDFNDCSATKWEDVERVLEKASVRLEEQV